MEDTPTAVAEEGDITGRGVPPSQRVNRRIYPPERKRERERGSGTGRKKAIFLKPSFFLFFLSFFPPCKTLKNNCFFFYYFEIMLFFITGDSRC